MNGTLAQAKAWLGRTASAARALRWRGATGPRAVTAWMPGAAYAMVRVDPPGDDGRPRLSVAQRAGAEVPRAWRALAQGSTPVLVLPTAERNLLILDRPQVPDEELAMAVRWPAAAAQELDPDQLLCTPLTLPASNAAAREQLLVVSAAAGPVKQHLASLRQAGIDARSVDVVDSALLGMLRLQSDPD